MRGIELINLMHNGRIYDGSLGAILRRDMVQNAIRRGNAGFAQIAKANSHRAVALSGGGAREVARRARQLAKGQLQVSK